MLRTRKMYEEAAYASLDEPGQRHPGGQAPTACSHAEGNSMKAKSTTQRLRSRALFTIVGGVVVINPAFAQQPATSPVASQTKTEPLEEVVVTGLRASLQTSMDIKRTAVGVVDAIAAEDMGKFPDTNLAESLQRITGISIDRRNGEGAQVTARG